MSVHPSRRRGPLPADIEFACLDGASSGWSEIEQRRAGKGKGREGEVEIVPSVRMPVIQGLDGVSPPFVVLAGLLRFSRTQAARVLALFLLP